MPLLDTIIAASVALDAGDLHPSPKLDVLVSAATVLRRLKPQTPDIPAGAAAPIRRFSGWKLSKNATYVSHSMEKLVKKLRAKLKKKDKALDRTELVRVFDSFAGERWNEVVGGEAVQVVIEACVRVGMWDRLEDLISGGFVKGNGVIGLVEKLVEKHRADLICLTVRCIPSLRPSDIVTILRYFLIPTRDSVEGMLEVRKKWEKQGLIAIEKANEEGLGPKRMDLARESSILVMMAHDGFKSSELCLHHVFSSSNAEGLVMSSAISRLDGSEVLGLVRYFRKWLEKYERFPEARPCVGSNVPARLDAHEWVPSLEAVVKGLSVVLDEHFSHLVLNPEFHDLLKSIEKVVKSLASAANGCRVLANVIEIMPSDTKRL